MATTSKNQQTHVEVNNMVSVSAHKLTENFPKYGIVKSIYGPQHQWPSRYWLYDVQLLDNNEQVVENCSVRDILIHIPLERLNVTKDNPAKDDILFSHYKKLVEKHKDLVKMQKKELEKLNQKFQAKYKEFENELKGSSLEEIQDLQLSRKEKIVENRTPPCIPDESEASEEEENAEVVKTPPPRQTPSRINLPKKHTIPRSPLSQNETVSSRNSGKKTTSGLPPFPEDQSTQVKKDLASKIVKLISLLPLGEQKLPKPMKKIVENSPFKGGDKIVTYTKEGSPEMVQGLSDSVVKKLHDWFTTIVFNVGQKIELNIKDKWLPGRITSMDYDNEQYILELDEDSSSIIEPFSTKHIRKFKEPETSSENLKKRKSRGDTSVTFYIWDTQTKKRVTKEGLTEARQYLGLLSNTKLYTGSEKGYVTIGKYIVTRDEDFKPSTVCKPERRIYIFTKDQNSVLASNISPYTFTMAKQKFGDITLEKDKPSAIQTRSIQIPDLFGKPHKRKVYMCNSFESAKNVWKRIHGREYTLKDYNPDIPDTNKTKKRKK